MSAIIALRDSNDYVFASERGGKLTERTAQKVFKNALEKADIKSKDDKLKDIKQRLNDDKITYNEVNCVLAMVKLKNK